VERVSAAQMAGCPKETFGAMIQRAYEVSADSAR
jgi:hypothetical protein